jgi:ABC-type Fe3+ transport system permease subunit
MRILALYAFVDLFVALPIAYALLEARRAEGEDLHQLATVLACALWPLSITIVGLAYLVAPGWFEEHLRRVEDRDGRKS